MALEEMSVLVYTLFWPMTVAGLALAVAWRFVPRGPLRTRLQIAASVLFFLPQVFVALLWRRSILLILHQEAVLALWMIALAGASVALRRRTRRPVVSVVIGCVFGLVGLWLGVSLVRDLVLPRIVVEGRVERMWRGYGGKGAPAHRWVSVRGRAIETTTDVFARLRPGDEVRAEMGAGSGMALAVERRP